MSLLASPVCIPFVRQYHHTYNDRNGHPGACKAWCTFDRSSSGHTGHGPCTPYEPSGLGVIELSIRCPAIGYRNK